jgi:hypothetical protein
MTQRQLNTSDREIMTQQMEALLTSAEERAAEWRDELYMQIGRAAALLGVKESAIRYIESLAQRYDLAIGHTGDRNREYSLRDLTYLWVLIQMTEQWGVKHSEAIQIFTDVLQEQGHITSPLDQGLPVEYATLSNGFVLSRVSHFLLMYLDSHLKRQGDAQASDRIVALLFMSQEQWTQIQSDPIGLLGHLANVLVCARSELFRGILSNNTKIWTDSKEEAVDRDTTITFIQDSNWSFPADPHLAIRVVPSSDEDPQVVLAVLRSDVDGRLLPQLASFEDLDSRCVIYSNLIRLINNLAADFRPERWMGSLRFCSDGLPPMVLHRDLPKVLQLFTQAAFDLPLGEEESPAFAVLLTPDSLDYPSELHITTRWNYEARLAEVARLRLGKSPEDLLDATDRRRSARPDFSQPEGLSGEAYRTREIIFSRNPRNDARVVWAEAEGATSAVAIPLLLNRRMQPYGVLYAASREGGPRLTPERIQILQLAASILAEQLGFYWLKLLRHWNEQRFFLSADNLRWLKALDREEYQRVLDGLTRIGINWIREASGDPPGPIHNLSLTVIDIYHSRQLLEDNADFPLLIPRALDHLEELWRRLIAFFPSSEYTEELAPAWFRGDHLLLTLPNQSTAENDELEVRLNHLLLGNESYPLEEPTGKHRPVAFQAIAATTLLSSQQFINQIERTSLLHPNEDNEDRARRVFAELIEQLRRKAGATEPDDDLRVYHI